MVGDGGPPTLIDEKGMGGVVAQEGFDYQLWDGLVRLPAWLANPGFEELLFEGLEDFEARFFAPHAPLGRVLERYQAKSGGLSRGEIQKVLASFQAFESACPGTARVHTLVTPQFPAALAWLSRVPSRVRQARPFYAPFPDAVSASDDRLKARLTQAFGDALGAFAADSVDFDVRHFPDRDHALRSFQFELERGFSLEVVPRRTQAAFSELESLGRRSNGVPRSRADLVRAFESGLGQTLPVPAAFPLHIRSDRNEVNDAALEIDASAFSGGGTPFPPAEVWGPMLVDPLVRTARWLRARGDSRVALGGSYRLTTAMLLGWSFRSAHGFELEIPTRDGVWATDSRSGPEEADPGWRVTGSAGLHDGQLVVSIGVLRDPSLDLAQIARVSGDAVLGFHLPRPIDSGRMAQASASFVKGVIVDAVARFGPRGIRLYMAGPAAFAVALGHRWNALPITQLHEFLPAERCYIETVAI